MLLFLGVDMSIGMISCSKKKRNHQTYEASISGGTDKFKYYSSISYLKQEGIAINSGLERNQRTFKCRLSSN